MRFLMRYFTASAIFGWIWRWISNRSRRKAEDHSALVATLEEARFRTTKFTMVGARPPSYEEIMDPNWLKKPAHGGTSLTRIMMEEV